MNVNGNPFDPNGNFNYFSSGLPQTLTSQTSSTAANPIPAHLTPAQKQAALNKLHLQQLTGIQNQQFINNSMVGFQANGQQNPYYGLPSSQPASAQFYQNGVSQNGNWNLGPQTSFAQPVGTMFNQPFAGPSTSNPPQTGTASTSNWYPPPFNSMIHTSFLQQPTQISTPAALPPPPPVPVPIKKRQKKNAVPQPSGSYSNTSTQAEPMVTTPAPPTPPAWDKALENAFTSLTPFVKTEVPHASFEQSVLTELVADASTLQVNKMERIVNLGLWKKFTATRKELLTSKSDDLALMSGLGLTDSELQVQAHVFMNCDPPPGIPSYSDNVALLFHCTRGSVDAVLSQGLDERLGRDQGLLGRGIYFTDDPMKSVNYDGNGILILFAVLLGDCYSVDHIATKNNFVREPEKVPEQRRNHSDLFFDSIVGRPAGVNEFVIYNRNQCVPLYLLHYTKQSAKAAARSWKATSLQGYASARSCLPPFAWSAPRCALPLVCPSRANAWPFFAQTIFNLMGAPRPNPPPPPVTAEPQLSQDLPTDPEEEKKLNTLLELGFTDVNQNIQTLSQFGGNLERTVNALLDPSPPPVAQAQPAAQAHPAAQSSAQPLNLTHGSTFIPQSGSTAFNSHLTMPTATHSYTQPPVTVSANAANWGATATASQLKKKRQDNISAVIDAVASGRDVMAEAPKPKARRYRTSKKPPPVPPPIIIGAHSNTTTQSSAASSATGSFAYQINGNSISVVPSDLKTAAVNLASNNALHPHSIAALFTNNQHSSAAGSSSNHSVTTSNSSSSVGNGIAMPTITSWNYPTNSNNTGLTGQSNPMSTSSGVSTSSTLATADVNLNPGFSNMEDDETECPICCNETPPWMWEELKCSHKLCSACHDRIKTSGRTMMGIAHTFVKCPFCQGVSGTEIGTCPDGTMITVKMPQPAEGYEGYGSISVTYHVNSGKYQINRTGYLPDTPEGERLSVLLGVAWDRRLVFSLGTSMTTGQTDVLVWNIHHKTGLRGGVQDHAYPDPTYLDRLKEELRQYAIE